jgi:hypothetical protein
MISRYVWQCGACCLSLDAIIAKSRTIASAKLLIAKRLLDQLWIVAPEAYHQGPLSPNLYAVAELCSSVAAHVQALTIPAAMRPGGTDRDAELNSSAELVLCEVYRVCSRDIPIITKAKNRPIPI